MGDRQSRHPLPPDDLPIDLAGALRHVRLDWGTPQVDAALSRLPARRAQRAAQRSALVAGLFVLVAGGAVWMRSQPGASVQRGTTTARTAPSLPGSLDRASETPSPHVEALTANTPLRLDDGSVVTPENNARVELVRAEPTRVEVRVLSGTSRFVVAERPEREFRVVTGALKIDVYATEFSVSRAETTAEVWSRTGMLRVELGQQVTELRPGQRASFSLAPNSPKFDEANPPSSQDAARPSGVDDGADIASDRARAGSKPTALASRPPRDPVADMLGQADAARAAGEPEEALAPLRAIVAGHRADARAPLAAFTLGRVLLDDLARPREAATSFALARRLAPDGALAEDALAREVEAWAASGEGERAEQCARDYVERYPRGHRLRAVKQYGGL